MCLNNSDPIDHAYEANRYRNIIAAIENLITQMNNGNEKCTLYTDLHYAKAKFQKAMEDHLEILAKSKVGESVPLLGILEVVNPDW